MVALGASFKPETQCFVDVFVRAEKDAAYRSWSEPPFDSNGIPGAADQEGFDEQHPKFANGGTRSFKVRAGYHQHGAG